MELVRQLPNAIHVKIEGEPPDTLIHQSVEYGYATTVDGNCTFLYFRKSWWNEE